MLFIFSQHFLGAQLLQGALDGEALKPTVGHVLSTVKLVTTVCTP